MSLARIPKRILPSLLLAGVPRRQDLSRNAKIAARSSTAICFILKLLSKRLINDFIVHFRILCR